MTKTRKILLALTGVALCVAGLGIAMREKANDAPAAEAADTAPAAGQEAETAAAAPTAAQAAPAETAADPLSDEDVKAIMAPRSLGSPDAPVKMDEYASLSCPHCADFSKNTLPKVKEAYIDTGKVYYTYYDFPFNKPAMSAAIVALCMPKESYFRYLDYLFESQSEWIYSGDQEAVLVQNAKLLGADGGRLQTCLKSERLKKAMIARLEHANKDLGVDATPTFILNGNKDDAIAGDVSFDSIRTTLDNRLEGGAKAGK